MLYGPMNLDKGVRVCITTPAPINCSSIQQHWVKFGTITAIKKDRCHIHCDDGVLLWVTTMGKRLVGTLLPSAPICNAPMPKKDILHYIHIHNTNIDNRTVTPVREDFDNLILDCVAIHDTSARTKDGNEQPILIYPTVLRFNVGDIVQANFLLEMFEVRRTDTEGYAKIVKTQLKNEKIGGTNVLIPTYTVLRSYIGITTQDYNQHHVIRDVKIQGKQTMMAMSDSVQVHVRKEFFDIFYR